jgi:hypothetical protein
MFLVFDLFSEGLTYVLNLSTQVHILLQNLRDTVDRVEVDACLLVDLLEVLLCDRLD